MEKSVPLKNRIKLEKIYNSRMPKKSLKKLKNFLENRKFEEREKIEKLEKLGKIKKEKLRIYGKIEK